MYYYYSVHYWQLKIYMYTVSWRFCIFSLTLIKILLNKEGIRYSSNQIRDCLLLQNTLRLTKSYRKSCSKHHGGDPYEHVCFLIKRTIADLNIKMCSNVATNVCSTKCSVIYSLLIIPFFIDKIYLIDEHMWNSRSLSWSNKTTTETIIRHYMFYFGRSMKVGG